MLRWQRELEDGRKRASALATDMMVTVRGMVRAAFTLGLIAGLLLGGIAAWLIK